MKRGRGKPARTERMPKPIAPNPWRRGRRRTGGPNAQGNGATQAEHSQPTSALRQPTSALRRSNAGDGTAEVATDRPQVIGLFADRASAELACRGLAQRGYREDTIVAIYSTPSQDVKATLSEILSGSGLPYSRVAEYETALRSGAVLLSVLTRSQEDARLIEIEWRQSYCAEKVRS